MKNKKKRGRSDSGFRKASSRYFPEIADIIEKNYGEINDGVEFSRLQVITSCRNFIEGYSGKFFRNYYQRSYLYDYVEKKINSVRKEEILQESGIIWQITDVEDNFDKRFDSIQMNVDSGIKEADGDYHFSGKESLPTVMQTLRKIRNFIVAFFVAKKKGTPNVFFYLFEKVFKISKRINNALTKGFYRLFIGYELKELGNENKEEE